jgi:hypothetical protein
MPNPLKIPTWADEGYVNAVVETPRGITCKADFDPDPRVFTFAKPLMAGLTYPYDWASFHRRRRRTAIPSTVIHDAQAYPGVVLRCRPIGILELEQTSKSGQERNDRIRKAKGLGAALQTKILQDLAVAKSGEGRVHMHRAEALIEHSIATLRKTRPELKRLSVAGDFRRGCELVDDFAGGRGTVAGRAGRRRGRPKGTSYLTNRRHFGRSWS